MLIYPQLATGALSQFPIRKGRKQRTVVNTASDGTSVKLADPNGGMTQWELSYENLSDSELSALEGFFAAAEGSLNGFVFLDPAGNLLAWSNQLDNPVWEPGPMLSVTGSIADPLGGTQAWRLANTGNGAQAITQTIQAPSAYLYCMSVYVRAAQPTTATLLVGNSRGDRSVNTSWARIDFAASGDVAGSSMSFGLELPAGASVDLFGPQVEAQGSPSLYKATTTGGVYPDARLASDSLKVTSTGVNRHSCTVNIIHADHL